MTVEQKPSAIDRMNRLIKTMTDDDMSASQTDERARFVERCRIALDVIDEIKTMTANTARITALEGFIRDFAACKFHALPHPFILRAAHDHRNDVTYHAAVLAWQDDARELLKGGYLVENTKTGEHHRCASEGQARRWAVTNGWTDYTITEGEK